MAPAKARGRKTRERQIERGLYQFARLRTVAAELLIKRSWVLPVDVRAGRKRLSLPTAVQHITLRLPVNNRGRFGHPPPHLFSLTH
ncbi:hypothetical protein HYPDE_41098 [Hyphomicrobium denitrificans 1NES1]|uniref:Uncharacterized protein n=1 Tax=Hyphomicrobium denitrificans 1NES1 TaxID=670307 RepID=N0BA49_9HYPH|nr:hypothetical protein HYPDE_41098 [Hyphomicrobium denitrificans 1NES1]